MFLLQDQGGGGSGMLIMMALVFGVMYFFMIRPQRKKEKELQKMREEMKKGDEVITSAGIYGEVWEVNGDTVIIVVESAAKIKILKSSIVTINGKGSGLTK